MLTPKQMDLEAKIYKKVSDRPEPNAYLNNLNYFVV